MVNSARSVAAIYDIHGNLPAFEAVLADIDREGIERILVGGDVAAGPMPQPVIARLRELGDRAWFVRGNADRLMVEAFDQTIQEEVPPRLDWASGQLTRDDRDFLASFDENVVVEIEGIGTVRFCHGSPRSDEEIITAVTSDARLAKILADVAESTVVCGHTHHQFEHRYQRWRVIDAGSVGMPYEGTPGARWLELGARTAHRTTFYDTDEAAKIIRRESGQPDIETWIEEYLRHPATASYVAELFEKMAIDRDAENTADSA
jgi:predicted phosphodiesterase